jgi:hypothetical protein
MKKILLFAVALFLFGTITTQAANVNVNWVYDTVANTLQPVRNAWTAGIQGAFFNATSTTATSTLPNTISQRIQSLTSAGLQFFSNAGTLVADFGAGGGSNASFFGGVNVNGQLQAPFVVAGSTTGTSTFAGAVSINSRFLNANSNLTLQVGPTRQYTTIQEAVNRIPYFITNPIRINIDCGTYTEDVSVQQSIASRLVNGSVISVPLIISGSSTNPTCVTVNSFTFNGTAQGSYLGLANLSISTSSPYAIGGDNQLAGLSFFGITDVGLNNITFTGGVDGILCYESHCMLENNVNFGNNVLSGVAIKAKRGNARVDFDPAYSVNATGTVGTYAYDAQDGASIYFRSGTSSTLTGNIGLISQSNLKGGQVMDVLLRKTYTIDKIEPVEVPTIGSILEITNENSPNGLTALRLTENTGTPSNWLFSSRNNNPSSGLTISGGIVGSERLLMSLDNNRDIGFGTTSGATQLPGHLTIQDVSGNINRPAIYSANASGTGTFYVTANGDLFSAGALLDSGAASGTTGMVLTSTNSGTLWMATSSLGITSGGSGTVNSGLQGQIAYYPSNGASLSGTSTLFFNGTNVGIGTTSASTPLQVVGTIASGIPSASQGNFTLRGSSAQPDISWVGMSSGISQITTSSGADRVLQLINTNATFGLGLRVEGALQSSSTLSVVGTTTLATTSIRAISDITGSIGSNGSVLLSTGTSTLWVATSSLGISGGGGGSSNWSVVPGGIETLNSTSFARAAYFVATSTTATSTFAGNIRIAGNLLVEGDLEVEGGLLPLLIASIAAALAAYTMIFTNKRIQPRTASSTSSATLTPDLSSANIYYRTTQTTGITINAPIGTPVVGETILIYIDAAGAQTLTVNSTYKVFGAAFPASLTAGKTFMLSAQYNGTDWKALWANAV